MAIKMQRSLAKDKPALTVLSKAINNAQKHGHSELIGGVTFAKIVQNMYCYGILNTAKDIRDFLEPNHSDIKVWLIDSYATEPMQKTFSIDEFVKYIINGNGTIIA